MNQRIIFSFEQMSWWGPRRKGYTNRISEAGRYSLEDADKIVMTASPGDLIHLPDPGTTTTPMTELMIWESRARDIPVDDVKDLWMSHIAELRADIENPATQAIGDHEGYVAWKFGGKTPKVAYPEGSRLSVVRSDTTEFDWDFVP